MNDQPLQKVVGKPYMIMEYDPTNGYPIRIEFGLYDARNEYLPGVEGAIPEPFMSASSLSYADRLGLYGSIDLLCNWEEVSSVTKLPSGDFQFTLDKGTNSFGHEIFHFTFTPDGMEGEILNSTATWVGVFPILKLLSYLENLIVLRYSDDPSEPMLRFTIGVL